MSIENNNNSWTLDKKKLLDDLVINIVRKFWIEKSKVIELINKETILWLDWLKKELINQNNKLDNSDLEKLFFTINWAHELIKNYSKIEIKTLKEDVEKIINIEDFKNRLEEYLPANLLQKAKNPNNIHEHILGFALWSTNSILTTIEYLYKIWKWIIQTPYHIYMILLWKAKTDSFNNI